MKLASNLEIYWGIAKESYALMQKEHAARVTPKNDGTSGNIINYDPHHSSFKQALICITFCGVTQDAIIFIKLVELFGRAEAIKIDKKDRESEKRLKLIGITDQELIDQSTVFRLARKEIVHEKAVDLDNVGDEKFKTAQEGANLSMRYMEKLLSTLAVT